LAVDGLTGHNSWVSVSRFTGCTGINIMATRSTSKRKAPDFEKSLDKLEALVTKMESGELSLEDSLKAFEEGVKLTRECQERLASAEQKVKQLVEEQGNISLEDIDSLPDEDDED
jgi:exodeoxyribonuclease VII small subunit